MIKQSLISDFVALYSKISSMVLTSGDPFLIKTMTEQLESLIKHFIYFLQARDNKFQLLDFQLSSIVTTLSIFSHLKKIPHSEVLKIERDSLVFRKSLFAFERTEDRNKTIVIHKTNYFGDKKGSTALNSTQKRILGFIDKERETLNLDVFEHFKDMSKRTLKRHLSRLASEGYINRESQGKKVYYRKLAMVIEGGVSEGN